MIPGFDHHYKGLDWLPCVDSCWMLPCSLVWKHPGQMANAIGAEKSAFTFFLSFLPIFYNGTRLCGCWPLAHLPCLFSGMPPSVFPSFLPSLPQSGRVSLSQNFSFPPLLTIVPSDVCFTLTVKCRFSFMEIHVSVQNHFLFKKTKWVIVLRRVYVTPSLLL